METTIGARLKELRKALRLTQAEFGERIGVKTAAVGNWEIERQQIPDARIVQICTVFNICREWLENGSGEMFAPQPTEKDVLKDAVLLIFRSLNKDAQTAIIETLQEYNRKKEAANLPKNPGGKNGAKFGSIDTNIEK